MGVVGTEVAQHALGRAEDQRERRAQLVAHVGEELGLHAVQLLQPRVQQGQLLVGLLQPATGLGHLAGSPDDLGLGLVDADALRLCLGVALQTDVVRDVTDRVDDVGHRPVGPEDRGVVRAPEALLESAAFGIGPRDVVLLDGHGVAHPVAQHPGQRCPQVAHALGGGVVGVVGEDVEDAPADDCGPSGPGRLQVGVAGRDDDELRVEDEEEARGGLEEHPEVGSGRRSGAGWGVLADSGGHRTTANPVEARDRDAEHAS